jgi:hypothetical protein
MRLVSCDLSGSGSSDTYPFLPACGELLIFGTNQQFATHRLATLYLLSSMTTYGHSNRYLKDQWQLMGALEALNGMLLFGLTTAFLFAMIQSLAAR